jgi:hypothetical protein
MTRLHQFCVAEGVEASGPLTATTKVHIFESQPMPPNKTLSHVLELTVPEHKCAKFQE